MFYFDSISSNAFSGANTHYHGDAELYFLTKGQCNYLIDNELFEINEGDLIYIPRGVIHKSSYSGVHSRMLINCSEDFVSGVPLPSYRVYRNESITDEILALFKKIEKEYQLNDSYSQPLIEAAVRALLVLTYRNPNRYRNERQANKNIRQILEYLNENFSANITLGAVSEKYSISPEHISRTFRKETGLNFNDYLSQLRLKKAEGMLKFGNQSVAEIAYECGFNDSNYFSEKFKRVYKQSPLQYRKANRYE